MREHGSMEEYADWKVPTEKSELSASKNLSQREATLFEKMRHSGQDLMKVLAFVTAFSVMSEGRALAKGDQPSSNPDKPIPAESAKEMKPVALEDIIIHKGTEPEAQANKIIYSIDGKTLGILGELDMSIEGNSIVVLRDKATIKFFEIDGVTTDSVAVTSEISGMDTIILITCKNSNGSIDVMKFLNGKYDSAVSTVADSLGIRRNNK